MVRSTTIFFSPTMKCGLGKYSITFGASTITFIYVWPKHKVCSHFGLFSFRTTDFNPKKDCAGDVPILT